jgi:zinc transport system permease protein
MPPILADFDAPILDRVAQNLFGWQGYQLGALLAVLLVSGLCGLVGALVVGNRMAFFSDAMAHCAFAGISLGLLIALWMGIARVSSDLQWFLPVVMAAFGALVGVGIVFVQERTGLANDTVIGVFFAGALGFGAMILSGFRDRRTFDPERFLFGGPLSVAWHDLVILAILFAITLLLFAWKYNQFVLASFNPSLARSRRVPVALDNYLFVFLLALIVNFSISAVGVLLINGLLIVPAATASNVSVNMRQMFRYTFVLSLLTGIVGLFLSWRWTPLIGGQPIEFGASGTITCVGVILFAGSMTIPYFRRRFAHLG